jgi:type II secretory pathway predicted ATPase ExeA
MYLEHFNLTHPPFAESVNPDIFFPGSRREEVCQSLILDIVAGKPLLKLIGREGSGKTLICRLIEERLPETFHVVAFEHPIGSFDDLLRIVCLDLGMTPGHPHAQGNLYSQAQQVLARQQAQGVRVVLLIDEAEKLFMAALERLVRHVGDGAEDLDCTLVLVGRPGLDSNLEQMASVSTRAPFSAAYELEDLTESETRQYLRFRANAAGMARDNFAEVFTEGAVARIYQNAKGNLRLTNILAEETLQNFCAEKSFMVLLDHVEPEADQPPASSSRLGMLYELLLANKKMTGALVGAMVLVLGIGLFLNRSGDDQSARLAASADSAPVAQGQQTGGSLPGTTPNPMSSGEQRDGEAIFRERLGASANWLAGMYKGGYTIQLMMLSSPKAASSLAGTLVSDDYYPVRDQLYILRKRTNPPMLFVFYGVYDSLDAAREARNGMPVFLRKHQPYPLSISEAMRKIEQ